jgi:spore germination cell wall hydrolase CwlJ-like protein
MTFIKKTLLVTAVFLSLMSLVLSFYPTETRVSASVAIPYLQEAPPYDELDGLDSEELACLQQNIYFEGRNQTGEGMAAIGLATINRLLSVKYPDTICEVITQGRRWKGKIIYRQCQYSWFCDRLSDDPKLGNPIERLAWEHAGAVALEVMRGEIEDFTDGSTHYHYYDMPLPHWAKVSTGLLQETIRADDHIFYKMI